MIRIGFGYDIHRLAPGRELWLGCLLVPHDRGLLGHSDGDVVAHALCDAAFGAAGLGDLGHAARQRARGITEQVDGRRNRGALRAREAAGRTG